MTQEQINKVFMTELGQQCDVLYTTSNDAVFIRYEEALAYANNLPLEDKTVIEWFEIYDIPENLN